jgi:hypothetical protein
MTHEAWAEHLLANGVALKAPEIDYAYLNFTPAVKERDLEERQSTCAQTTAIKIDITQQFVDWDVQMSNVACASESIMDIYVANGWQVANSVGVSGTVNPTIVCCAVNL